MSRGQLTIVGILGLALVAAGLAVWWRHSQTRKTLEFMGPTTARLIVSADKVELLQLEQVDAQLETSGREFFRIDGMPYQVVQTKDVSKAPGFLNARHALTMDRSYRWQDDRDTCEPVWQTAMRFSDERNEETILFCFRSKTVRRLGDPETVAIPRIAASLQKVMDEQLNDEIAKQRKPKQGVN